MSERVLRAYWATWDPDQVGDRIARGAFAEDIKSRGPRLVDGKPRSEIKLGYNHETVIGLPLKMVEDERGLYVEARVDDTTVGADVLKMIESGTLDSCSFSYDVLDSEGAPPNRVLKRLRVYEGGPVDWPCNKRAAVLGLKSDPNPGAWEDPNPGAWNPDDDEEDDDPDDQKSDPNPGAWEDPNPGAWNPDDDRGNRLLDLLEELRRAIEDEDR